MKNPTFFLVDDDTDDTLLFEQVLREVSPSVKFIAAADGQEALDLLAAANQPPDLIFLDLNMPKMDGKQCLSLIKADPAHSKVPVIIYTTSSLSKDIEQCMISGAAGFITKPSGLKELKIILAAIVNGMPGHLHETLQKLSNSTNTFIVV